MKLENYITHGEYLDTIELAYKIKRDFGINDYYMFKKMCMIVAYNSHKHPYEYPSYGYFLGECFSVFSLKLRIECTCGLNNKKRHNHNTTLFFGVPIAYIYDKNILELDEYLTKQKY